jgi:hypothetical protein
LHALFPAAAAFTPRPSAAMLGLFRRLFGRERSTLPPFDFARNRFPMRKKWPPAFRDMTEKQKFRFERKFKRRIRDKAIRPEWNNKVKVFTWSLITFIAVYGVLFHDFANDPMNPRPGEQPFKSLRAAMWRNLGKFYTHTEDTLTGGGRGARRQDSMPPGRAGEKEEDEDE